MGRYFVQDTSLAGLERLMMTPPNFVPGGTLICSIRERGETSTLEELIQELVRSWEHIGGGRYS